MIKRILVTTLFFSSICFSGIAQPGMPDTFIYDPDVVALISSAKELMSEGDYEGANKMFRRALATKKTLPTDMSYFFAETLFIINQFQNSKNFIDKYLKLAGQGGDYYDEALKLQTLLTDRFNEIRDCELCNLSGYRFVTCDNCHGEGESTEVCYQCKGHGLTTCPKCTGMGVLISFNSLGQRQYESCSLCESKGYVVCTVCHGEKTLSGTCTVCLGTGHKVSSQICNHQDTP